MGRRKCLICGVALKGGAAEAAHFKSATHRRKEKTFRKSYGSELSRKLERLMNRWSGVKASRPRRK